MDLIAIQKKLKNEEDKTETSSLKQTVKKIEADLKNPIVEEKKPEFAKRVESFKLTYQFEDEVKVITLTSKIMDYEQRMKFDRVLSELTAGLQYDNLAIEIRNKYIILSRVVCQLVDPPEWLLKVLGEDIELCYSIGGRLVDHETRFFRYNAGEGATATSKPRFSLD